MPGIFIKVRDEILDLKTLTLDDYTKLEFVLTSDIKHLVDFADPMELVDAIAHLTNLYFDKTSGAFITSSWGDPNNFLRDLIFAYVKKYDIGLKDVFSPIDYTFSDETAALLRSLHEVAGSRSIDWKNVALGIARNVCKTIFAIEHREPNSSLHINGQESLFCLEDRYDRDEEQIKSNFTRNLREDITRPAQSIKTPGKAIRELKATLGSLSNGTLVQKTETLMKKVEELGLTKEPNISMETLAAAVDNTNKLLSNQITVEEYKKICKEMPGTGSKMVLVLSVLMLSVAAALSLALASPIPIGVGIGLTAIGFFNTSKFSSGLAKAGEEVYTEMHNTTPVQ